MWTGAEWIADRGIGWTGTPLRDGSGKATAPGKGPKDGSGANANCPNPPKG